MVDLTILAEAAARDPLLGAFVLMATGALVSRLLFKQQPIWRAIVRVVFLILLTLLLLHNGIVPYEPLHSTGTTKLCEFPLGGDAGAQRPSGRCKQHEYAVGPGCG
jgi:hypothetical protein